MSLFELFGALERFREKRLREKLSQKELLKQELGLIGLALLVIATLGGLLYGFVWWSSR